MEPVPGCRGNKKRRQTSGTEREPQVIQSNAKVQVSEQLNKLPLLLLLLFLFFFILVHIFYYYYYMIYIAPILRIESEAP